MVELGAGLGHRKLPLDGRLGGIAGPLPGRYLPAYSGKVAPQLCLVLGVDLLHRLHFGRKGFSKAA